VAAKFYAFVRANTQRRYDYSKCQRGGFTDLTFTVSKKEMKEASEDSKCHGLKQWEKKGEVTMMSKVSIIA